VVSATEVSVLDRVKVGFIGAGNIANAWHYPSVAELAEVAEMAAVCDLDEERLNATADRYQVTARFTDLHEMLDTVDLDAVYCIGPPMMLMETVIPCLQAGRHVFTEKPLGMSADEAGQMAQAAAEHNCLTMVGFNRRFAHVIARCKQLVDERGGPTQVVAEFHKHMLGGPPYYDMSIVLMDVIHSVDLLRHLCGDPLQVVSSVRRRYNDWDNIFNALLVFDNNAVGLLTANRASGTRYERFEIHGRGIACYIRAPERAEVWTEDASEPIVLTGKELAGTDENRITYGYLAENEHFLTCVRDGLQPIANFADAARTMRLCETIEQGDL
jgi:predicted dehydrogenase